MTAYTDVVFADFSPALDGAGDREVEAILEGAVLDITAPTVNSFTPSTGVIAPSQSIAIQIGDAVELNSNVEIVVSAYYPALSLTELVYNGSFHNAYTGSKVQTSTW